MEFHYNNLVDTLLNSVQVTFIIASIDRSYFIDDDYPLTFLPAISSWLGGNKRKRWEIKEREAKQELRRQTRSLPQVHLGSDVRSRRKYGRWREVPLHRKSKGSLGLALSSHDKNEWINSLNMIKHHLKMYNQNHLKTSLLTG